MTVIIKHGLIAENKSGLTTAPVRSQLNSQVSQTPQTSQTAGINTANAAVALGVVRSADAALPSVRVGRANGLSEKIRDPKEASRVADEVSEQIRQEEDGDQAHSELAYTSAREHFV